MTLTTHATIGAVIGAATGNPFLALAAGFVSHFLVDMIPHGDSELYKKHKSKTAGKAAVRFVTIDAIIAIIVVALMVALSSHTLSLAVALGVIGSILPDLVIGIQDGFKIGWLKWFTKLHFFFHNMISKKTGDMPLRYALVGQAVVVIVLQRFF